MKKLIQILLLLLPLLAFGQTPRVFTGKCNISQTGSGSGYWTVAISQFNDPLGLYDASEIQVNDKLLFNDGGIQYVLNITLVSSAVGNSATVRVSNVGITGISSVPTFTGASITRGTANYGFIPFVANISDNNQQGNQEYNMYRVDSILAIKDSANVIPLSEPISFGGVEADTVQEALEVIDARLDSAMNAQPVGQLAYGNAASNGLSSEPNLFYDEVNDRMFIGYSAAYSSLLNPSRTKVNIWDNGGSAAISLWRASNNTGNPYLYLVKSRGTISSPSNYATGDGTISIGLNVFQSGFIKSTGSFYGIAYDSIAGSTTRVLGGQGIFVNTLTNNETPFWVTGRYGDGAVIVGKSAHVIIPKAYLHIRGENSLSTRRAFYVENSIQDSLSAIDNLGTLRDFKYGLGNKEASDLGKTPSQYVAGYATDGSKIEVRMPNGIYTPTITKNTATDTIVTVYTAMYSQNDSIVSVSGQILLNTEAATTTSSLQLSLPPGVTTNFTDSDNDISGTVTTRTKTSPRITTAAWATVDTSTDKIVLNWDADGGTGVQQYLSFNLNFIVK